VRVFVDTNVFVYLFDAEEPAKQQRAREVVSELMRTSALVLSSQVLSELYVTVTRKLACPLEPAYATRYSRSSALTDVPCSRARMRARLSSASSIVMVKFAMCRPV